MEVCDWGGAVHCTSVNERKAEFHFFLFHLSDGESSKPWGVGFDFSEGTTGTHSLCIGIMLWYYALYYDIKSSHLCLMERRNADHWSWKMPEQLFHLKKKKKRRNTCCNPLLPCSVCNFVIKNVSSEGAVHVRQIYMHLYWQISWNPHRKKTLFKAMV